MLAPAARAWHDSTWRANYRVENPIQAPLTMTEEGDGPTSPFFPSSATTTTGDIIPSDFFLTSKTCGRCHRDIYDQWNSSAHHFSSFNNQWYRKSIEYMQDVVGTEPSKWCAGCHDHAVFFNGQFDRPIRDRIWAAPPVIQSSMLEAQWVRVISSSNILRCTTSLPATTRCCPGSMTSWCQWHQNHIAEHF